MGQRFGRVRSVRPHPEGVGAYGVAMPGRSHEDIMVRLRPWRLALAVLMRAVVAMVLAWRRRAGKRDDLRRLTDRQLDDIGLSRAEAEREAAKPFWRD